MKSLATVQRKEVEQQTPSKSESSSQQTTGQSQAQTSAATTEERNGLLLLQQRLHRDVTHEFLETLKNLAKGIHQYNENEEGYVRQAFISYAWPPKGEARTNLQTRLLNLVDDINRAGIEVLLDLNKLKLGVAIDQFMKNGIETSDAILLIGAPDLFNRLKPGEKNNAMTEFCHIKDKVKSALTAGKKNPLIPILKVGSVETSYPLELVSLGAEIHDFTNENDYFLNIPKLAAKVVTLRNLEKNNHLNFQRF